MRILVLVKQVPVSSSVRLDSNLNIDRRISDKEMNPADKSALSAAILLRDSMGGSVCCLSMGPPSAEDCLREAALQGADSLVLLSDKCLAGADSLITATALSLCINKLGAFDLILCGQKTVDGETGQVGPEVASALDLPVMTAVTRIESCDKNSLLCRRLLEREEQLCRVSLPAVVSLHSIPVSIKLPSLKQLRDARNKKVISYTAKDIGLPADFSAVFASPTRVIQMRENRSGNRKCVFWSDNINEKILPLIRNIRGE